MNWEYKVIHIEAHYCNTTEYPPHLNAKFTKWGEEGWELIKIEPILSAGRLFFGFGSSSCTKGFVAFFKRPKF